jgi:biopolymer transport protein ExbD
VSPSPSGYSDSDEGGAIIAEINVTPLVDVVLVLLVIFMVTATYIVQKSLKVDLPRAASASDILPSLLSLQIDKEGTLILNHKKATEEEVKAYILKVRAADPGIRASIAADRAVPHGRVVQIMDLIRGAGVEEFAISVLHDAH